MSKKRICKVDNNYLIFIRIYLEGCLNTIRKKIIKGLDSSFEKPSVHEKYQWLKDHYNDLIILYDDVKLKIRELNENIAGQNIHYLYTDDFYNSKK
jgi:hypothetical protein